MNIKTGLYSQHPAREPNRLHGVIDKGFRTRIAIVLLALLSLPVLVHANEEVTIMLPGDVPMTLVHIPAGTFMMGSPENERGNDIFNNETLHEVTLTQDYYIGKTEVTQAQWLAVMGSPIPDDCDDSVTGDNFPAGCLTWYEIAGDGGFIEMLNEYLEGDFVRLPTEAEWERAARGGTQTRFAHGDVLECSDDCGACAVHDQYMWWCGNSSRDPKEVGLKLPNQFGLHDMHGNQWEYVQDRYGEFSSSPVTDPTGPSSGNDRVIRGGDYFGEALFSRAASRVQSNPGDPGTGAGDAFSFGFRIAATELPAGSFQMDASLNGNWWFGPGRNGEGAQVEISAGANDSLTFVVTFYSYDLEGNQIFLIAVGTVEGDSAEVDVFITEGGIWGANYDPALVGELMWGTGTFTATGCDLIQMELRPNAEFQALGYTDLSYDLVRLTTPLTPCPLDN